MTHSLPAYLLALAGLSLPALAPAQVQAERFVATGAEVLDTAHGLIWQRCALGQTWTGLNCAGGPQAFNHGAALQAAQSAAAAGVPWRLPNIKELASLALRNRIRPAIDTLAFPDAPGAQAASSNFWSSTHLPAALDPSSALTVLFYDGQSGSQPRNALLAVRLVRTAP